MQPILSANLKESNVRWIKTKVVFMVAMCQTRTTPSSTVRKQYDLNQELKMHGWQPFMTYLDAEKALSGKSAYTYLIRSLPERNKFVISFVRPDGEIEHDQFTLLDPIYGIWRNAAPHHVGTLAKVIRDMMDCEMYVGQPL